jgi:hypothetical protein
MLGQNTALIAQLNLALTDSITLAWRSWPSKPGRRRVAVLPAATAVAPVNIATVWKRILEIDWWLTGVYLRKICGNQVVESHKE